MTEGQMLLYATSLLGIVFSLLVILVGSIGGRMIRAIDALAESIIAIKDDLTTEVAGVDRRVVRVETRCDSIHPEQRQRFAEH